MNKHKKLFYGWRIVIAITILYFTGGAAPLAIVLKQLMEQFHTGRGEVSICQSISMITMGITGIFVGRLLQRCKPRTFLLLGFVASGINSIILSFLANGLSSLYFFYFVTGLAAGFTNAIVMLTLLSKWFTRKWGTAVGIVMAGGSVGSIVIQPLVGIIAQNFGWRLTYLFAGLLILAINVPLILFVLKDTPEAMGLFPNGDESREIANHTNGKLTIQTKTESSTTKNNRLLSYLKNPSLWLISISFAFVSIGSSAITTHEVSFLTDMKVSATLAASALGITLGIGAISALASGWLADRLTSRYVSILFFLFSIAGMLILIQDDTMSKIWLFIVIYGFGIGASGTLLPIVTRDIFGTANFSTIFGFIVVLYAVGIALGAPLAGFMFDATGSYHSVFLVIIAIYVAATLGIYFAFGAKPKPFVRISILSKYN